MIWSAETERTAPEESARRERSRDAYSGYGRGEAIDLAKRTFPNSLLAPAWRPLSLQGDERLKRYLSDRVALVDAGAARSDILVESLGPLRVRGTGGELGPVDLELVPEGNGYRPRRSGAPSRLPRSLAGGFEIPGVSVAPVGVDVVADVVAGKTFYPSFAADSDLWATPLVDGLEIYLQLRSAKSPERFPIKLSLPGDAHLQESVVLPGAAEIVRGDRRIALVRPPMAWDAEGTRVPVSYEVTGDSLTVVADHRGRDLLYPLLVDPAIVEDQRSWRDNGSLDYLGWRFETNAGGRVGYSSGAGALGAGLYMFDRASMAVNVDDYGRWRFDAPGTAFVMRAEFARVSHEAGRACAREGIMRADNSYEPGAWMRDGETLATNGSPTPEVGACANQPGLSDDTKIHCTSTTCGQHGTPGSSAIFSHEVWNSGADHDRYTYMGGARVYLSDIDRPNFTSYVFNGPAGWVDNATGTVNATVNDTGLGVQKVVVNSPDHTEWSGGSYDPSCRGDRTDRCPQTPNPQELSFNTAGLPEGIRSIRSTALDPVANEESRTSQIKIDRTPPEVTLSGSLYDRRGQVVPDGVYELQTDATDGDAASNASARSGVEHVEVRLDSQIEAERDVDCTTHSCALELDWSVDTARLPGGSHQVDVLATDRLGRTQTATFSFEKGCCLESSTSSAWLAGPPQFGDVTGDGLDDAVGRSLLGGLQVSASDGRGFGSPASWGSTQVASDFEIGDANGDGFDDVLWVEPATLALRVALSNGSSFGAAQTWGTAPGAQYDVQFADVDADTQADVVAYAPTGEVRAAYSSGDGFEEFLAWSSWDPLYSFGLADVTGDGAADAIGWNAAGDVHVRSSDFGSFASEATSWGAWPDADVIFADVDGDGLADVVGRNPVTGAVEYGSSTGDAFGPRKGFGEFSGARLDAADVTGDGREDLVGLDSLAMQIRLAASNAPTPLGPPADTDPADVGVQVEEEAAELSLDAAVAEQSGSARASAVRPPGMPRLAAAEERVLNLHDGLDPEHPRVDQIDHTYLRLRQMGVSLMRFWVYWGGVQNRPVPGAPGMYWRQEKDADGEALDVDGNLMQRTSKPPKLTATTAKYDWRHVTRAVAEASAAGMRVHLTLTGTGIGGLPECAQMKNYAGIGCEEANPRIPTQTGLGPGTGRIADYGEFFRTAIELYRPTPDIARDAQAFSYGVWNEPNGAEWLAADPADKAVVPIRLYRRLYEKAHQGWQNAGEPVGTQILIGELSSGVTSGRDDEGERCTSKRCAWDAMDFLTRVVDGADDPLLAHGLAYHPYQHKAQPDHQPNGWRPGTDPVGRGKNRLLGIGRLGQVNRRLTFVCKPAADGMCTGKLKSPGGRRPGLYLTEFNYLNQPRFPRPPSMKPPNAKEWHREAVKADWFSGRGPSDGALRLAARAKAKWMLIYQFVEDDPYLYFDPVWSDCIPEGDPEPPLARHDYGLIGLQRACDPPGFDIRGDRPYGKPYEAAPNPPEWWTPQPRKAYCAIRRWAADREYFGEGTSTEGTFPDAMKNECSLPNYADVE